MRRNAIIAFKVVGIEYRTNGNAAALINRRVDGSKTCNSSAIVFYRIHSHTEFGIDPDIKVDITSDDWNKGRDTIIETAKALIFAFYDKKAEEQAP